MHLTRDGRFERTDIWREGKWLDLWSVVHFLSGATMGFVFFLLPFNALAALVIAFLLLTAYEMWEKIVEIEEAPTNRVMDVVVGMLSFVPTYFLLAPELHDGPFILVVGLVFTATVVLSVFGWIASQKAAVLESRVRERYARRRARLLAKKLLREQSRP